MGTIVCVGCLVKLQKDQCSRLSLSFRPCALNRPLGHSLNFCTRVCSTEIFYHPLIQGASVTKSDPALGKICQIKGYLCHILSIFLAHLC